MPDDVLLAENRENMEGVIKRLGRFLKKRGLELNVEKSNILVSGKGREAQKDKVWQ